MARTFALFVIVLIVISGYTIFQCANVVAYNNFSRSIIAATHLLDIEFLDVNPATLEKGYFTSLLTFENPSNQPLNMTKLVAAYYQANLPGVPGALRIALGNMGESIRLGPGRTQIILQMNLDTNASFEPPCYWVVSYRLKFGSAHYGFTSEMLDSVIETKGPFSTWESQAFTLIATYTLLAVDAWALGLEAMGALILFQERKIGQTARVAEEKEHNRMLSIIYASQGIGLFVSPSFVTLINSVLSEPPPEFYYVSGAGALMHDLLIGFIYLTAFVFLVTALGILLRKRTARGAALFLSSIGVFVWLFGGVLILTRSPVAQDLALATLLLATTAANGIALYLILRSQA